MSPFGSAVGGALVFASVVAAAPTAAQDHPIRTHYGIGLGRTIPTGDVSGDASGRGFETGWLGTAHVTLQRDSSRLGLLIDAVYSSNGANDQLKTALSTQLGQPADESVTLVGANASLTYVLAPRAPVTPSLAGGVGLYHVSVSLSGGNTTTHNSTVRLAWHVGGEVSYGALFLAARYVAVAAFQSFPKTTLFPITLGARFGHGPVR